MTSLRQRMTEDMQVRNLSPLTRSTYLLQVSLFARHFHQSPEALGPEEIRSYQSIRLTRRSWRPFPSSSPSRPCLLYKVTLRKDWKLPDIIQHPKTAKITGRSQPGGGPAVSRLRHQPQASHPLDHLLRCRLAHLRSRLPQTHCHRQPADGYPRRTRQGAERPLHHALPQAAGHPSPLVARGQTSSLALPRRYPGPAHHPGCRGASVSGGASTLPYRQTHYASFLEACLRRPSARGRHRRAHHPIIAGAS